MLDVRKKIEPILSEKDERNGPPCRREADTDHPPTGKRPFARR